MYILMFMGPFIAPNDYTFQDSNYIFGGPSQFTMIGPDGRFGTQVYVYGVTTVLDKASFKFIVTTDYNKKIPIHWLVKGDPITLLGFIHTNTHLFGLVNEKQRIYLFGADSIGRDEFSRTLTGGQVSMTVGLLGVAFSIVLGSILGTISGYYMGVVDDIIQRIIEVISAFPTIPLWAALAAALPPISGDFTALDRYFLITLVLSLVGWTGLGRQLRAKVMAYRSADFCQAALAIPGMILGETSLSFLGLGITPPTVSWGSLLRDSQQVSVIVQHPWILIPGLAVVITVLFFSFLGDGIRDAVDPYSI